MKHIIVLVVLLSTGCVALKTRQDLREEEPARQTQARPVKEFKEPKAAQAVVRGDEVDDQFRNLNGRVDTIENQLNQINAANESEKRSVTEMAKYSDTKFGAYEEELKKLEAKVVALEGELATLKQAKAEAPREEKPAAKGKGAYEEGEEHFGAKKWKEAIVSYQKYRDANPKGKQYAEATYKIGVCFQELKMKDEAKAFFEEVVTKFPSSKEAKKAAFRTKTLK